MKETVPLCPWVYSSFSETAPAKGMKQRLLLCQALWRELAAPCCLQACPVTALGLPCFPGICGPGVSGSDSEGSCDAVMWLRAEWCTEPKAARAPSRNAVTWTSPHSLCQFTWWLTQLLVIKSLNISGKQEGNKTETYHSSINLFVITSVFTRQQICAGITFTHRQGTTHMQLLTHTTLVDRWKLKWKYLQWASCIHDSQCYWNWVLHKRQIK